MMERILQMKYGPHAIILFCALLGAAAVWFD